MTPHVFEPAASGRSKCRGCGRAIAKGEIRFGEQLANPYADGEMTLWFHPLCAAYKRPEAMLQALEAGADVADKETLARAAQSGLTQRRLPRVDGAQRAPSTQARCRHCHEPIERGTWRIRLVFFEEGRFNPSGYVHAACVPAYFETGAILERALHFSPDLAEEERAALRQALAQTKG